MNDRSYRDRRLGDHQSYQCGECGVTFIPKASNRIKYCSRECSYAYGKKHGFSGLNPLNRRLHWPLCVVYPRVCCICSRPFIARQKAGVACSDSCRRQRTSSKYGHLGKPLIERFCRSCGAGFTPRYGDKRRTFCSNYCTRDRTANILIGGTNLGYRELPAGYIELGKEYRKFRQLLDERNKQQPGPGTEYYGVAVDAQ